VGPVGAFPSSVEDGFWMNLFDAQAHMSARFGTPSSPSDVPDDAAYTPLTPLTTSPTFDGASLFGSMPMDFNTVGLGMPAFQPSSHEDISMFALVPPQLPSTPPSSMPLSDLDISPAEPLGSFPIRTLDAKRSRRRRIAVPKVYRCDVEGCSVSFTSSRRDIERHKASVHGPPVVLECGESLSYRPDNIARHRKKCEACSAAHVRRCEEDGGELKLRPGRKRKVLDAPLDE
jgi:hypothetical protein